MKNISKRKPRTTRTVERLAKKVLRVAEGEAKKLAKGVKKLRTAARKPRAAKPVRRKLTAAKPRKRTASRARARA